MMTNSVIAEIRQLPEVDWSLVKHLAIVADCGPHFRSKENVYHYCVTLPLALQISVEVCWLGEQHGKSEVDRCFGWCNGWISEYILTSPIHSLDHLIAAFKCGSDDMMKVDPEGPVFRIVKWQPGTHRPSPRLTIAASDFKVTRTYSLHSKPTPHTRSGVSIRNNIFSDKMPAGQILHWDMERNSPEEPVQWRVGYYDKPRTWESRGPLPGETNQVTQRFEDQKNVISENMPTAKPNFLETCSLKALSLRRMANKKKRQLKQIRDGDSDSSDSTTSSSSSSSDSESADNEP